MRNTDSLPRTFTGSDHDPALGHAGASRPAPVQRPGERSVVPGQAHHLRAEPLDLPTARFDLPGVRPPFHLALRGQPHQGRRQLPFQVGHTAGSLLAIASRQADRARSKTDCPAGWPAAPRIDLPPSPGARSPGCRSSSCACAGGLPSMSTSRTGAASLRAGMRVHSQCIVAPAPAEDAEPETSGGPQVAQATKNALLLMALRIGGRTRTWP